eukprot:m.238672 g.238672  ORF g.238672 m.238672 type:complete len:636 (-) comp21931_c0_seq1:22-1929(-)
MASAPRSSAGPACGPSAPHPPPAAAKNEDMCEDCHDREGKVFCTVCKSVYCIECDAAVHVRSRKDHERVPADRRPALCEKHKKEVEGYCAQEERLVCASCMTPVGECSGHLHAIKLIDAAADTAREELQDLGENFKGAVSKYQDQIGSLKALQTALNERLNQLEAAATLGVAAQATLTAVRAHAAVPVLQHCKEYKKQAEEAWGTMLRHAGDPDAWREKWVELTVAVCSCTEVDPSEIFGGEKEESEEEVEKLAPPATLRGLSLFDDSDDESSEVAASSSEEEEKEEENEGDNTWQRNVERIKANASSLAEVDFQGQLPGDNGAQQLATALKNNTHVTTLNLARCGIGAGGATVLAAALRNNFTLHNLNLSGNVLGAAGVAAIVGIVPSTQIRDLELRETGLNAGGVRAVVECLRAKSNLLELDLSSNDIRDEGAAQIAAALKVNNTLTKLDVRSNNIGNEGARELGAALRVNSALQVLQLPLNDIGPAGARALADGLKVNTTLEQLRIYNNQIGPDGACAFADALRVNSSLKTLILFYNKIGDVGACALAAALHDNATLSELDADQNDFGNEGARAFLQALKVNVNIAKLDMSYCGKVSKDLLAEIAALVVSPARAAARDGEADTKPAREIPLA